MERLITVIRSEERNVIGMKQFKASLMEASSLQWMAHFVLPLVRALKRLPRSSQLSFKQSRRPNLEEIPRLKLSAVLEPHAGEPV